MKKIDITYLLIDIGVCSGCFKIRWETDDGLRHSDLVVFDEFLDHFVWYDDYGIYEDKAIICCKELLQIEKFNWIAK